MAVYKCDGEFVMAKDANSAIGNRKVKEIKTVWSGKLSDLVVALVGEFESISIYGRLGTLRLDGFVYGYELIDEGFEILKAIKRNLERAEELLYQYRFINYPKTASLM